MLVVTGGAGFIGSNLVASLRARGREVLVVDYAVPSAVLLQREPDAAFMEPSDFLVHLGERGFCDDIEAILHQGACTDTLEQDPQRMMEQNFVFSARLLQACLHRDLPLIYASSAAVYGSSSRFSEDIANERPLNLYGVSKLAFDQHVRNHLEQARSTVVGLRYFNVFGRGEAHKGPMASMVHQIWHGLAESGQIELFGASHGFGPGEQRRDFICVDDVVTVILAFAEGPPRRGIFNLGTGVSRSFNSIYRIASELGRGGHLSYRPFPNELLPRYQGHTQAELTKLRACGIDHRFMSLEEGMQRSFATRSHRA